MDCPEVIGENAGAGGKASSTLDSTSAALEFGTLDPKAASTMLDETPRSHEGKEALKRGNQQEHTSWAVSIASMNEQEVAASEMHQCDTTGEGGRSSPAQPASDPQEHVDGSTSNQPASTSLREEQLPGPQDDSYGLSPGTLADTFHEAREANSQPAPSPPTSPAMMVPSAFVQAAGAAEPSPSRLSFHLDERTRSDLSRLSIASSPDSELAYIEWQNHKRHYFILNSAGKPIFSRHGDEHTLAHFTGILQAIISVVIDQGDMIRHMEMGRHQYVFLMRGHIYLVAVSCAGEPLEVLRYQLELLYNHILFIVTSSVEKVLQRNPAYDVAHLLAGTAPLMRAFIKTFSRQPGYFLKAMEPLPLAPTDRRIAQDCLKEAVEKPGCLYGIILVGFQVVAIERRRGCPPLHPWDLLLLSNLVNSHAALRQRHGEAFSPVCLPHFNPNAFLHAYILSLEPELGLALVLLSAAADSFHALSSSRQVLETHLHDAGVLQRLRDSLDQTGQGRVRIDSLEKPTGGTFGTTPLWHFLFKLPFRHQFVMPAFTEPFSTHKEYKQVVRGYARLHAAVFKTHQNGGGGLSRGHRTHWVSHSRWIMVAYVDREYELYAVLDPLTDRELACRVCEQIRRHFMDKVRQGEVFIHQ